MSIYFNNHHLFQVRRLITVTWTRLGSLFIKCYERYKESFTLSLRSRFINTYIINNIWRRFCVKKEYVDGVGDVGKECVQVGITGWCSIEGIHIHERQGVHALSEYEYVGTRLVAFVGVNALGNPNVVFALSLARTRNWLTIANIIYGAAAKWSQW